MNKQFFLTRLLSFFAILMAGLGVLFILLKLFPDHHTMRYSSLSFGVERQAELQKIYQSNRSVFTQFIAWTKNALALNFGHSYSSGKPVITIIQNAIKPTLALSILSLFWAILISIPLSFYSAQKRAQLPDSIISTTMMIFYSIPAYWIGMMLLYFLSIKIHLFPSSQIHSFNSSNSRFVNYCYHLVLPSLALGIGYAAYFYKFLRVKIIEILDADYLMAAISRGLSKSIIFWYYIMPNFLIVLLSLIGTITPAIIGGTVTVEYIFSIPGLGRTMVNAAVSRDVPLIMGIASISFFFVLLMNVAIDFMIKIINPQTRSINDEKLFE